LVCIDAPSHYDAPEFFLEPYWTGKRPFVILALDHGRAIGVFSGLHGGDLQFAFGGLSRSQIRIDNNADALLASDLLADGLLQEAEDEELVTFHAWSCVPLPGFERRGFLRHQQEGRVVLDLSLGADALYKDFHENRKRNIRIAIKNGIEVIESSTQEDLHAYWSVYSAWRRTSRKTIVHNHSFATTEQVHLMRRNHRRFLARFDGRVIAATGLRFHPTGLVEYANNCSLDEFIPLRPNDLLLWRTIEWACEQGFEKYSLGGANPFFRKSGGNVLPIYRYRLDRTFLHRHELKDRLGSKLRSLLRKAPTGAGRAVRKLIKRVSAAGQIGCDGPVIIRDEKPPQR